MRVSFFLLIALCSTVKVNSEFFALEVDGVFEKCCEMGYSMNSCDNKYFDIRHEVPEKLHDLCRTSIDLCCEKKLQEDNCKAGREFAKNKSTCVSNSKRSEMFKLCCSACKVGQHIAMTSGECDHTTADPVIDKTRNDCCAEFDIENSYEFVENDSSGDKSASDDDEESPPEYIRSNPCEKGFVKNFYGTCVDFDECVEEKHNCNKFEICVNTYGDFKCEQTEICPEGFFFYETSKKCEDIDECGRRNPCSFNENCINTLGSFKCLPKTCDKGYKLNSESGNCEDIDECENPRICDRLLKCRNLAGSYSCDCDYGLRKHSRHDLHCQDIDECLEQPGICDQKCFNTYGSYQCYCDHGFKLGNDSKTCSDINECERNGRNICMGICKNTIGSFKCDCPEGFNLVNNRDCVDIDECKDSDACDGENDFCLNTFGSFKCFERKCSPGYRYSDRSCHLMDHSLCYDSSHEITGKCLVPTGYGFVFGHLFANCTIPEGGRPVFNFNVPSTDEFQVEMTEIVSRGSHAYENSFELEKHSTGFKLKTMKPIDGPQEIEFEILIHFKGGRRSGDHFQKQKVFIIVSDRRIM